MGNLEHRTGGDSVIVPVPERVREGHVDRI